MPIEITLTIYGIILYVITIRHISIVIFINLMHDFIRIFHYIKVMIQQLVNSFTLQKNYRFGSIGLFRPVR